MRGQSAFHVALSLAVLFLLIRKPLLLLLLLLIATSARFQNPGWKLVPPTIYSVSYFPTMIRCSDSPSL